MGTYDLGKLFEYLSVGESRVNGNGATPPRTPPGTPKKSASPRSASPRTSKSSTAKDLTRLHFEK